MEEDVVLERGIAFASNFIRSHGLVGGGSGISVLDAGNSICRHRNLGESRW